LSLVTSKFPTDFRRYRGSWQWPVPLEASAPTRPSPNRCICAAPFSPPLWYSRSPFIGFFASRNRFQDRIVWMVWMVSCDWIQVRHGQTIKMKTKLTK
jgi:hypothetical protein